jgi:hypothetical protein
VAPDSPAAVKVTSGTNSNETIADDFIYLLVRDIDCPHADTEDDCDCHNKQRAVVCPAKQT